MKNLKQITLAAALILGCVTLADAKSVKNGDVVWADVTHGYTTTDEFTFRRVTLTDTATIVAFDFDYPAGRKFKFPKRTHLVTDGGQQLKLLRMEGVDFGQWLTTDGTTQHYVMHFEPAPKSTRWLHYVETGKPGDWNIGYIRDKSRKMAADMPAEWRKVKYDRRTPLPAVRYAPDSAFIRVHVVNYDSILPSNIYFGGNIFCSRNEAGGATAVNIDKNGDGTMRLRLPYAMPVRIYIGRVRCGEMLVQPGETAECLIDLSSADNKLIGFKGAMADVNYDLFRPENRDFIGSLLSDAAFEPVFRCTSPETRADCLDSLFADGLAKISRSDLGVGTKDYLRMRLEYEYRGKMWNFSSAMINRFQDEHPNLPLNQARLDSLGSIYHTLLPIQLAEQHLACKHLEIFSSPSAPLLGDRFFKIPLDKVPDSAQLNRDLLVAYRAMQNSEFGDSTLASIHDDGVRQVLVSARDKELALLAEIKSRKNVFFHELDSVAPERILAEIIGRYKGHVVLVDVWESWCGQCRRGHEQMVPVKKELADRNIRYVYLSSPSSDPAMWNKLIADIEGDHFFLTDEQMRAVANELQSTAVPTYAIYDAEGNRIYKQRGVDTPKLKAQLLKATE